MESITSTADVKMDLHIRGFMIMMIFYISAFSLFVHNLFCGGKHYVGNNSVPNDSFIPNKMRKNSNIDFRASNISKSGDDDDDSNLYHPVSNIAFASNYKNRSIGKNYDCAMTDDLGLSLLFLLVITYIMHILEFWHSNTWIELRSIVEWPTAHKLITNCSRASPVIWWRVLTYRRRMRWNLEKVLPQQFVNFLTTSKDCTNFRLHTASRSFAQFHSQMERNNHHEPPSTHPSLLSFNPSIASIHPSVHYFKPSCSTSKTAIRPSESLMTTASTRPLLVMSSSSSSSSSVMTSCNENLCGIATNHSNSFCSVCCSHCHHHHHHNHRHHHYDNHHHHDHHHHHYDHIQHHQDFNFLHQHKNYQTHSTRASISDDPEILDLSREDGRMDRWFTRLLRRMLTEKYSQAEFCSAFDHTQFSVTDATACLDLSTFTSHITRVQIKKICNLSSTTSLIEYNKQKSSFIDEVLFKREVDENNLRETMVFDGFVEMTETFDLVSFNVDPTLNSSAYNIVLHYPNMFLVSKPGGSTPWFSKTVTLWLAALTVLSWPLRILISHKKVTVCCPVIKIFGISKDKSAEITNTPQKTAPSSIINSTPKKEMPIIDTNFIGDCNENVEKTSKHDVFKNSMSGVINQKTLSIPAASRKNDFKTFINHGEPLSNSKDNYNNQTNEVEDTPPSYEEVLNMNTTEFNSSQGQCHCGCHGSISNATPQVIKMMTESPVNTGVGNSFNHRKEIKSVDEKWPIRNGRRIFGRLFQNKIYHNSKTRILQLMETSL